MKFYEDKYPVGSINNRTPGRYTDETLYKNMEILAKSIVRDMTFLSFIFSSTLEVGTGKSVFASQLGEMWTYQMKKLHNIDLPFDMNNCVFKPEQLIERSFKLPKYSFIWLDEWEDAHYWSKLGITLRQFFRKCRQLNLFMVAIIPDFFECPISYAIPRSVFAIDVQFKGEFERGYFSFYNFDKKRELYIKGKKERNYKVVAPNFSGRFLEGYAVNEKEYREVKLRDLADQEKKPLDEKDIRIKLFKEMREKLPELSVDALAEAFGISRSTGFSWLRAENNNPVASS